MTMASCAMQLAICGGPVVTTWNCRNAAQEKSARFRPCHDNGDDNDDVPIVDVSWNPSGQVLASCSSIGNSQEHNVFLTSALHNNNRLESFRHDQGLKRPASAPTAGSAKATSIAFGSKSRYLTVGDDSGAVCLWDLKKKTRVRHYFHSPFPSLQATLDPTDTHVLSLSETAMNVFRLREGTLAATITASSSSSSSSRFTRFTTSLLEPQTVAIGTRNGGVDVIDTSLQTKLLSVSPHSDSVTGVAMSAVSKLLLASTSTDGTLAFSDIGTGDIVQRMPINNTSSSPAPPTALSFHHDGHHCAVGTKSGNVFVYDLRMPGADAIATRQVEACVTALKFAPTSSNTTTVSARGSVPTTEIASKKKGRSVLSLEKPSSVDSTDELQQQKSVASSSAAGSAISDSAVVNAAIQRESFLSEKMTTNSSNGERRAASWPSSSALLDKDAVREIVRQELDEIRDEMEEAVRKIQVEMCRQLMKQSQVLSKLQEENNHLRQENEHLRQRRNSGY